jgi:hypothetical protein
MNYKKRITDEFLEEEEKEKYENFVTEFFGDDNKIISRVVVKNLKNPKNEEETKENEYIKDKCFFMSEISALNIIDKEKYEYRRKN